MRRGDNCVPHVVLLFLETILTLFPGAGSQGLRNLTLWSSDPPDMHIDWDHLSSKATTIVLVQSGQRIRITHRTNDSIGLQTVDEDGFVNCRVPPNGSLSPSFLLTSSDPDKWLEPKETGSVLIIERDAKTGECRVPSARLNITWVGRECGSNLCARNGACALSTQKEVFTCFCCGGEGWERREGGVCGACNSSDSCCEALNEIHSLTELDIVDVCNPSPCLNGGICNPEIVDWRAENSFTCLCPAQYSGTHCEIKAQKMCTRHSCPPRNYCFLDNDLIECVPEYRKDLLQKCHPNICYNRGECYLVRGVPRCLCQPTYIGIFCKNNLELLEEEVDDSGGAFVALAGFLVAFSAAALLLLVCNCHNYSCQLLPGGRRREYLWENGDSEIPSTSSNRRRRKNSEGSGINREGFQMYTVDDLSMTSSQDTVGDTAGNHFGSERDLLVTRA